MPEIETPYSRMSRVTTRRGTLRQLNCPLEPELLVAAFSDELPPDVAIAVREHMAVCEICGKRAQDLHMPYALLASLGAAPTPYVPDLRESVRLKSARTERFLRPLRALGSLSRLGIVVTVVTLVTLLAILVGVTGLVRSLGIFTIQRTTNQLDNAPPAAARGALLAETDKLVTIMGADRQTWQVAEVIVADQKTGQVYRSLPASKATLHAASATTLPLSVVSDGRSVYELTTSQNDGLQALVSFDLRTGAVRFVTVLTQPGGDHLPSGVNGVSLAVAPNGAAVYVGLSGPEGTLVGPRALAIATTGGKILAGITITMPTEIPLPPPPGSLPPSAFPSVIPIVSIQGMREAEASGGAIAISPDGQALLDSVLVSDANGVRYAVVRRVELSSGAVTVLGLQGTFSTAQFAASLSPAAEEVYFVTGSPGATVYVLDATAQGPTLLGQVALGGPAASASSQFTDALTVSHAANGVWLYVTQDATSSDGVVSAHNRWLVDTQGMGLVASATDPTSAGALLGNVVPHGKTFALIGGQIAIGAPDLSTGWSPWLQTSDNTPIIRLIATIP